MTLKQSKNKTIKQILTLGNNYYKYQGSLKEHIEDYLLKNYVDYNSSSFFHHIIQYTDGNSMDFDWDVINDLTMYIIVALMKIGSKIRQLTPEIIRQVYEELDLVKYIDSKPGLINDWDKSIITIACEIGSQKILSYVYSLQVRPELTGDEVKRAAVHGYSSIIKFLIDNDIQKLKLFEWQVYTSALWKACVYGHFDVVRVLVENKLYTFKGPKYNFYSALVPAADNGYLEICKYLIQEIRNDIFDLNFALSCAASNGHLEIVMYLEGEGADIHMENQALLFACEQGHLNVVEYLSEKGSRIEPSFLAIALKNNHYEVAHFIINKGVDLLSAFDFALKSKMKKCTYYLIRQIIKLKPERLYEVKNYLTDFQKVKYAHLLTVGEFNLI